MACAFGYTLDEPKTIKGYTTGRRIGPFSPFLVNGYRNVKLSPFDLDGCDFNHASRHSPPVRLWQLLSDQYWKQ